MRFTIEVNYDPDRSEDLGGTGRGLANIVFEQDGVTRAKVYAEGQLIAEEWLEDRPADEEPVRHSSPQAWRRVRRAIGPGEADDLARDIASIAGGDPGLIEHALVAEDWDSRHQG